MKTKTIGESMQANSELIDEVLSNSNLAIKTLNKSMKEREAGSIYLDLGNLNYKKLIYRLLSILSAEDITGLTVNYFINNDSDVPNKLQYIRSETGVTIKCYDSVTINCRLKDAKDPNVHHCVYKIIVNHDNDRYVKLVFTKYRSKEITAIIKEWIKEIYE